MGIGPKISSSICDTPQPRRAAPGQVTTPNPNPYRYKVVSYQGPHPYRVLEVTYPDATNFEGRKILLFKDVTLTDLRLQGFIDPHFSDGPGVHPIARFVPTPEGMAMALKLAYLLATEERERAN